MGAMGLTALLGFSFWLGTLFGQAPANISGAEFQEDMEFWNESCPYEETKSLEDNLRNYEAWATKNQK